MSLSQQLSRECTEAIGVTYVALYSWDCNPSDLELVRGWKHLSVGSTGSR